MTITCDGFSVDRHNVAPHGLAGVALAVGDLIYLDSSGVYQLAVAGASKEAEFIVVETCLQYGAVSAVKCATFSGFTSQTIGSKAFLTTTGTTGNTISATKPAVQTQQVGIFFSATQLFADVQNATEPGNISVYGSDGAFKASYATIDLACAALVAHDILTIKSGEYTLSASCVISKHGVKIIGDGDVQINGGVGADNCFSIVLGAQTSTAEITFQNININHTDDASQVGIQINNTAMTKKLNVYIDDCDFESDGGVSVDIDHADTSNAIRLYCNRCVFEGAINMVTADAGDRMRFDVCTMRGGVVTDAGNFDLEMLYKDCIIKHGGISGGHSNQRCIYVNCVSETDADPNIYALVDGDDNVGSATDQIIGS
jgi:hypothetical protein